MGCERRGWRFSRWARTLTPPFTAWSSRDGAAYFLKLRKGDFAESSVLLPQFLQSQGFQWVIAPLPARGGQGWARLGEYRMILSPYVGGQNGYEARLTEGQWRDFGAALGDLHRAQLPQELAGRIPRETFSPCWREMVQAFQARVEAREEVEPVAAKMAAFLRAQRAVICQLVARTEQLALALQARRLEAVLCHADLHAGNSAADPGGEAVSGGLG